MIIVDKGRINKFISAVVDWLILGIIFLIPVCFALFYEINSVFVLYKMVILRVLTGLALIFLLAGFFLQGNWKYRFNKIFLILAAILTLCWSISVFFSLNLGISLWGSYERQQGLLALVFYLLFFLVLIFQLKDFSQIKKYLYALLFSSFFVCFYGLAQVFNFDPISWQESFLTNGRIFSTLGQPDSLGHFLILVIPFTVFTIIFITRRFLVRTLLFVLLFSQLLCLFFSYSRSAWLGLLAEIFLAIIGLLFIKGRKKIAVSLMIFILAVSILAGFWFMNSATVGKAGESFLGSRFTASFDLNHGSVKVRLNIWQAALAEISQENWQRRLFGYGPDSLSAVFVRHYQSNWALDEAVNIWPDRAHNVFLDIILSFGFVGLAAYLLFFGYLLARLSRFLAKSAREQGFWLAFFCLIALIGYFINNLFSFSDTAEYLHLYLILGIVVFLVSRQDQEQEIKIKLTKYSRAIIFVFVVISAGIFLFYYNWRPIKADYYFMAAIKNANSCPTMFDNARKAIAAGGEYNLFYAGQYVNVGLRCFDQLAKTGLQEMVKNNLLWCLSLLPNGVSFSLDRDKADTEAKLAESFDKSYSTKAEQDFIDLSRQYPAISEVYWDWARFSNAIGNYDETIKIVGQGTSTLPLEQMAKDNYVVHRAEINSQLIKFYDLLGEAYVKKNDNDQALYYYQKIIKIDPYQLPVYKEIADIYYQKGDWDKALWYDKRGYALNPKDYAWPLALGFLEEEKGDKQEAIFYFNEALKIAPDDNIKDIKSHLDRLQQ